MGFYSDSMGFNGIYPLVNIQKAMENGHRNSGFSHKNMVIFHCYVSLPEGKSHTQKKNVKISLTSAAK